MAPIGGSRHRTPAGQPLWKLYRLANCYVLHYPDCITYVIAGNRISYELIDMAQPEWIQIYLLSSVIAFWLELSGMLVLHASAVALPRGVVGFVASSTGGKSTLAAAAVAAGHPLVTDDLLALHDQGQQLHVQPGFPAMRLWPSTAAHFLPDWQALPRVDHKFDKRWTPIGAGGWGKFCPESQPLAALYVPQRRAGDVPNLAIEIVPLAMGEAVIELVRHSFAAWLTATSRLEARRLPFMSRVVAQTPVYRLVYPAGFDHLPHVIAAVEQA